MEVPPATPATSYQQAGVSSLLVPDHPTATSLPLQTLPPSKYVILHPHNFQIIYIV